MTIIIKIIIWTVICISNAVLLSVHVISIELPQFCEYERHTDIQPQRPYLLLAPIPVACRIRGAHGSKTACDAVRRKRNTLTRQPPFTPTPIPPPMVAPSGVEKRQSRRVKAAWPARTVMRFFPAQLFTRVCKCSWMRRFWLRFSWQPAVVGQDTPAPQTGDQARKRARKCALRLHRRPSRSVKCVFSFSGYFRIFWSPHRCRREEWLWMSF